MPTLAASSPSANNPLPLHGGGKGGGHLAPARHGTCRLTVTIAGVDYSLRPHPAPRPQCRCWILRSVSGPRPGRIYSVAVDGTDTACSCPDAARGIRCKHQGALAALGLLEPTRPVAVPRAERLPVASLRRHRPELPGPGPGATGCASAPPENPIHTDPVAAADGFRAAVKAHVAGLAGGG